MLSSGAIADRVEKLAFDISLDYVDRTISIICILKGLSMSLIYDPFRFPYNPFLSPMQELQRLQIICQLRCCSSTIVSEPCLILILWLIS